MLSSKENRKTIRWEIYGLVHASSNGPVTTPFGLARPHATR